MTIFSSKYVLSFRRFFLFAAAFFSALVSASGQAATSSPMTIVKEFTGTWRQGGSSGSVSGSSKFIFGVCIANYTGGDWSAVHETRNGVIVKGALPNLCYVTNNWTKDKVEALCEPKPLLLSSSDIFTVRPLFIFFNGTQDFRLTDEEVANLHKYITVGGAIWGDGAEPGTGTAFATAFRRENDPGDGKQGRGV